MGGRWKRRALLVEKMIKILKDLDIEYRMLPLDINVRNIPPVNYSTSQNMLDLNSSVQFPPHKTSVYIYKIDHSLRLSNANKSKIAHNSLQVTHCQTNSASINKTIFESDTTCGRYENKVSNIIRQSTGNLKGCLTLDTSYRILDIIYLEYNLKAHDWENNIRQQLEASKTPLLVMHRQTESASINKTMFESDTPCGTFENKVSNIIRQSTVYDRAKNITQAFKNSKTPSSGGLFFDMFICIVRSLKLFDVYNVGGHAKVDEPHKHDGMHTINSKTPMSVYIDKSTTVSDTPGSGPVKRRLINEIDNPGIKYVKPTSNVVTQPKVIMVICLTHNCRILSKEISKTCKKMCKLACPEIECDDEDDIYAAGLNGYRITPISKKQNDNDQYVYNISDDGVDLHDTDNEENNYYVEFPVSSGVSEDGEDSKDSGYTQSRDASPHSLDYGFLSSTKLLIKHPRSLSPPKESSSTSERKQEDCQERINDIQNQIDNYQRDRKIQG
ncbi:hypothetical protein CTI12_AA375940 [Artemisia annua]|uniref:Uncharacterized protein n=1 Tax=Artemisia annua TaxID=35608 RepID=A0A2U1MJ61_ARTAN|nr:hypothetical protein CTI12_AA375940 [Artemisia annua]